MCDQFNSDQTPIDPDNVLGPTHPFLYRAHRPTAAELCQAMIDTVLDSRAPDCADGGHRHINHDAEALAAGFYSEYKRCFPGEDAMALSEVSVFHLCHGMARIIVNVRQGRVLVDKVVDTGGWAQVGADAVKRGF